MKGSCVRPSEPGHVNPVRARIPNPVRSAPHRQPIPHANRGDTPRLASHTNTITRPLRNVRTAVISASHRSSHLISKARTAEPSHRTHEPLTELCGDEGDGCVLTIGRLGVGGFTENRPVCLFRALGTLRVAR